MRNWVRRTPGRYRAVVYALLLHVAVGVALVVGVRWSGSPSTLSETTIQAVVIEDPQKKKLEDERRRAEENRREEERKKAQAERERAEQSRKEDERKKAEAEKQRQADVKRKQEEDRQRQAEDRKKAEADAERKRQDDSRRKAAEESLKEQLVEEERGRAEAARATRASNEFKKFEKLIQQKVSRNWSWSSGKVTGLSCVVRVRLAPGGDVLEATVVQGSGNAVFDRSVPPAVLKASPLPLPPDPSLFEYYREINFVFRPEER